MQVRKLSIQNDMGGWAYMKITLANNPLSYNVDYESKHTNVLIKKYGQLFSVYPNSKKYV